MTASVQSRNNALATSLRVLLLCAVYRVFLSGHLGLLLMLVAMVTDSIRSGL